MSLFIYTLELVDGYFYVGTTKTPGKRVREHRDGVGAYWTSIHRCIGISKKYPIRKLTCSDEEARLEEDKQVKTVMLSEGIQ